MSVIEKIRDIWTRYGGGFNSLALIDLFVTAVGYISLLLGTVWFIFF